MLKVRVTFGCSALNMRRLVFIIGGIVLSFGLLLFIQWNTHTGVFGPHRVATWDFTNSRASAIVGWPTDKTWSGRDWWSSGTYEYQKITIILPNRPKLISEGPPNVAFHREGDQITSIDISEESVTQEMALQRLRALAKEWGWPWDETTYLDWSKRILKHDTTRIGAGDRYGGGKIPFVGASIIHSAATPNRPWYLQLHVSWRKEDTGAH